jgi:hypothetical protein
MSAEDRSWVSTSARPGLPLIDSRPCCCGLLGLRRRLYGLGFDLSRGRAEVDGAAVGQLDQLWSLRVSSARLLPSGQASSSGCCQPFLIAEDSRAKRRGDDVDHLKAVDAPGYGGAARRMMSLTRKRIRPKQRRPERHYRGHKSGYALVGGGPARQAADEGEGRSLLPGLQLFSPRRYPISSVTRRDQNYCGKSKLLARTST